MHTKKEKKKKTNRKKNGGGGGESTDKSLKILADQLLFQEVVDYFLIVKPLQKQLLSGSFDKF